MNNPKFGKLYVNTMLTNNLNKYKSTIFKSTILNSNLTTLNSNLTIKPLASVESLPAVSPLQIRDYYINNNTQGATGGYIGSTFTTRNTNPTIVIVNAYSAGSYGTDLNLFSSYFNLPQMNINTTGSTVANSALGTFTVLYQVATNSTSFTLTNRLRTSNTGWDSEIALDVQYAHNIAPYADIILILSATASYNDLSLAIKFANNLKSQTSSPLVPSNNIVSLSMSWGGTEALTTYNSLSTAFLNNNGLLYFAASGDTSNVAQLVPAICPNVIAVGGSSLNVSSPLPVVESGWNSSGGGISAISPKPSYQNNVSVITGTKRGIPDICSLADPYTGVYIFLNKKLSGTWGGTSLASPMVAATMALLVQCNPTYLNSKVSLNYNTFMSLLYTNNNNVKDVTSNSITVRWTDKYNTVIGYDFVTGNGSINFVNLLNTIGTFVTKR
jgi:subtilase family serine protease